MPAPTGVRRWFCAEHARLAQPGDLDPWEPPRLGWGPGGGIERVLTEEDQHFYEQINREREAEDARNATGAELKRARSPSERGSAGCAPAASGSQGPGEREQDV